MTKYEFSKPPWSYNKFRHFSENSGTAIEKRANLRLCVLAPTLHEVVTKCQAILSNYLEPEGKSKEDVIKEFLDILDDKELVTKLKELEV